MSSSNKDVKFIIYQVLYIFVIVVLTIKGADLDLTKVLASDKAVPKTYSDSLKAYIDSLQALGLVPRVEYDSIRRDDYRIQPIADLRGMVRLEPGQIIVNKSEITPPKSDDPTTNITKPPDPGIDLPSVQLVQFTKNQLKNNGKGNLQIIGDGTEIVSISPGETKTFQLMDQSSITYKQGDQTKTVSTKPNAKPDVSITQYKSGGEDASLRELQSIIGFRVTIKDDYPQYKVTFSGPVKFEDKGNGVYDIKLNYAGSKSEFDSRTANLESPYKISFSVIVKDEIAGHTVQRSGQYTFGGW